MSKYLSCFQKEVSVSVSYLNKDGERLPDTFNIYVIHRNKAQMLTNLDWFEIEKLATTLEEENKPIQLWREMGIAREILHVPKWARKRLAKKLRETKRIEDEKVREQREVNIISYSDLNKSIKERSN